MKSFILKKENKPRYQICHSFQLFIVKLIPNNSLVLCICKTNFDISISIFSHNVNNSIPNNVNIYQQLSNLITVFHLICRSGKYCYKPIMNKTCCPHYTIKMEVLNFKLNKSHKKILKQVNKYLIHGVKKGESGQTPGVKTEDSTGTPGAKAEGSLGTDAATDGAEPTDTAQVSTSKQAPRPGNHGNINTYRAFSSSSLA